MAMLFPSTTKTVTATPNPSIVNTTTRDVMGRVTRTSLDSDPQGADMVDTTYDELGRQKTVSNPHRAAGASTDGITTYQYDALNRTVQVSPPDGTVPTATSPCLANNSCTQYVGNTTTVTDQAGKQRRAVNDALGRPSGGVVTYAADGAGRTLSAVDNGNGVNYVIGATYPLLDRQLALLAAVEEHRRLPALSLTTIVFSPSRCRPLYQARPYFQLGTISTIAQGTMALSLAFITIVIKPATRRLPMDALNRLTTAQNAGTDCNATVLQNKTKYWGNSYTYDAWGNLLNKTITKCGAENLPVTADAKNQIHASSSSGLPGYQYDAAGNMTYDATENVNLVFDQENRLTGASGYTYTYDADGNRVIKSNGSTGTLYWYMTPGIVAESDLSGAPTSEYIFFNGERIARRDLTVVGFAGSSPIYGTSSISYYFSDHLKTASVITDSAGGIKAESDYYPWGGELQFINNDSNYYKFTGKERDTETGLDYFGARYYSNGLGRWVSADWSPTPVPYADFGDPQTLNLYAYVRNLPTTKISRPHGPARL